MTTATPNGWTKPQDLKAQLARLWERGELLREKMREQLGRETCFPLRLSLKGPTSTDITERFDTVRQWAAALSACTPLRLGFQDVRHRVQGMQRLPTQAWIDSCDDALAWLGKHRDAERFANVLASTRQMLPVLLPWLERRPLQALVLADDWQRLLTVVSWLIAHPRPDIYLRQVDVAGVHSKFIETHRGVLAELFDLALPATAIDQSQSGSGQFTKRYGFRDKPTRIRWRVLDERLQPLPDLICPDITLDSNSFSHLSLPVRRVFITENETNFLAFPPVANALVIFGAGYGWEALAPCRWLHDCALHYWGDIDTHGFAILDQLRGHFPHVESLLMDRTTFVAHATIHGHEHKPLRHDLPRLLPDERALYDDLRDNRLGDNLRLEQEHINFSWVSERLRQLNESHQKNG